MMWKEVFCLTSKGCSGQLSGFRRICILLWSKSCDDNLLVGLSIVIWGECLPQLLKACSDWLPRVMCHSLCLSTALPNCGMKLSKSHSEPQ